MLETLWMEEFKFGEDKFKFDDSGDINLGYDILMWRSEGSTSIHDVVAEYHPEHTSITYIDHPNPTTRQLLEDLKVGPHSVILMHKH